MLLHMIKRQVYTGCTQLQVIELNVKQSWEAWVELANIRERNKSEMTTQKQDASQLRVTDIRQNRQNLIRTNKMIEGPNKENQIQLRVQLQIVQKMLNLCFNYDAAIAFYSLFALCAISYDNRVSYDLGQIDNFVQRVISLCHCSQETCIRTQAALLLANMALNNTKIQCIIASSNGLEHITNICKNLDVHALEGGTAVIENLV